MAGWENALFKPLAEGIVSLGKTLYDYVNQKTSETKIEEKPKDDKGEEVKEQDVEKIDENLTGGKETENTNPIKPVNQESVTKNQGQKEGYVGTGKNIGSVNEVKPEDKNSQKSMNESIINLITNPKKNDEKSDVTDNEKNLNENKTSEASATEGDDSAGEKPPVVSGKSGNSEGDVNSQLEEESINGDNDDDGLSEKSETESQFDPDDLNELDLGEEITSDDEIKTESELGNIEAPPVEGAENIAPPPERRSAKEEEEKPNDKDSENKKTEEPETDEKKKRKRGKGKC